MKFNLLLISLLVFAFSGFSQADSLPVYKRMEGLPVFKLYAVPDSIILTHTDLPKKTPVIFFLFSPDCDHCKKALANLLENIELYKNSTIVMTSPIRYDLIRDFYIENHLDHYPNIMMGRDPSGFLNTFFENRYNPSIFIYKKGKLAGEVRSNPDFRKIAELL